jgi:hypothetical protein
MVVRDTHTIADYFSVTLAGSGLLLCIFVPVVVPIILWNLKKSNNMYKNK